MRELLTPDQMGACDAFTIARGTPGTELMERAGFAIAKAARTMMPESAKVMVLAGPGNNGGDGYVAARLLGNAGYQVTLVALGDPAKLTGDARWACEGWGSNIVAPASLDPAVCEDQGLIVDGLFGAGLTRGLDGEAAQLVEQVSAARRPVLAIDLPSGLDGRTGRAPGPVVQATATITFHRMKPGHALYPGRDLCGPVEVADIGIDRGAIEQAGFTAQLTGPYLATRLDRLSASGHKYARGHALVVGGPPEKAGAGFMVAQAALRAGAGLVTLAAPPSTMQGSVGLYPALMRAPLSDARDLARLLADTRLGVCTLGPGLAPDEATRQMVYAALTSEAVLVLDAGALTAFSGMTEALFARIKERRAPVVFTPHEGEFVRVFGPQNDGSKIEIAQQAAASSGAIMVLKGADTVVAHPNGSARCTYVNGNAPHWLATAGSGDVLAGILTGLLAHADLAPPDAERLVEAVALAVWLHGEAANAAGPAMIASDLEPALRTVLLRRSSGDFLALQGD